MVNAKKVFLCPFCEAEYDTWEEANDCQVTCEDNEVEIRWACSECDLSFHEEEEAENCCKEEVKK